MFAVWLLVSSTVSLFFFSRFCWYALALVAHVTHSGFYCVQQLHICRLRTTGRWLRHRALPTKRIKFWLIGQNVNWQPRRRNAIRGNARFDRISLFRRYSFEYAWFVRAFGGDGGGRVWANAYGHRKQIIYFILFLISSSRPMWRVHVPFIAHPPSCQRIRCRSLDQTYAPTYHIFALRVISVSNYSEIWIGTRATVNLLTSNRGIERRPTKLRREKEVKRFYFSFALKWHEDTWSRIRRLNEWICIAIIALASTSSCRRIRNPKF